MLYYCYCWVCMFVYVCDLCLWAQMSWHMHMYIIGRFHGMGFLFPWFSKISSIKFRLPGLQFLAARAFTLLSCRTCTVFLRALN